jgi:hypothetical protein
LAKWVELKSLATEIGYQEDSMKLVEKLIRLKSES